MDSLEGVRDFYRRKPTTRLTSLFEWDKRYNSKCFGEEIHPKYAHLLKRHLADQQAALNSFFVEGEELKVRLATIETFAALCSPTDTPFENLQLGTDYMVLFFAVKDFMARNASDSELLTRVAAALTKAMSGEAATIEDDKVKNKAQVLVDYASNFYSRLVRRIELESSAGSQGQLDFFCKSFEVAVKAAAQEAIVTGASPEDFKTYSDHRQYSIGAEPWLHLWTTLGFPSDPFLNAHNTDPYIKQLLQLAVEIIFLTNDVGSVVKDRKKGSQNMVLSVMHHFPGTLEKDAVDVVVSMIEHKADEFFEVSNKIPLVEADYLWYFELLKKVMRGNWQCQLKLKDSFYHEVEENKEPML